jgi:DNA-binding response OmpR family regulator
VLVSGHVRASDVSRARDSGANFFVTKPITPNTLLQRILFVGRDRRPFVNLAEFVGPDRRVKADGPPAGVNDRRDDDRAPLHPEGDDMSDIEIDAFDAQRVMI